MAAILDLSDFVNLASGGGAGAPEAVWMHKDARQAGAAAAATVAGRVSSLWQYNGSPAGGSNTAPTTSAVCTNATDGALKQTAPGGGRTKYCTGYSCGGALAVGSLIVYDRLVHQGGLSGTVTTAQTTNLPTSALTRYTTGAGVQIWLEIYTAIGATGTTVSASYTDQGGTTGNTTQATDFGGTGFNEKNRIVRLPLATSDTGARAVASVTVLATTGTAGAFGVVLARPLFVIPLPFVGVGANASFLTDPSGPIDMNSDACIAFAWLANTTTAPQIAPTGLFFVEK